MTPVQTTTVLGQSTEADRAGTADRPPIRTRAETVECNCPEPCERDHEVD